MAKYKLKNFLKESHPANDQWLEAFKDALGFDTLISPSYLIGKYGHLKPEEAAQRFMDDSTATQMANDEETYRKETGLEEDVNPYKISNRLFDHTATTANIGSTGEELHFNIIEITPETFTIEYRITSNSPNRPIGASRNYRSEPKEGVTDIKKDFQNPKSIQVRGTNFTVQSGEFMDQVYGDAASVAEGEFKFRPTETDAPGMQARPDGYLKESIPSSFKIDTSFQPSMVAEESAIAIQNEMIDAGIKGKAKFNAKNRSIDITVINPNQLKQAVRIAKEEFGSDFKLTKEKTEVEESIDFNHLMKVRAGIIK